MTRRATGFFAFALALALALAVVADPLATPETRAQEAVAAYTRALGTQDRDERLAAFRQARRLFADVARTGSHSPELYTNLGNAALLSEDLGQAVLAYRRALLLDPDQPRALQNLDHARTLLPSWVPRPDPPGLLDSFFFWHHTLPASTRGLLAASCFAVASLLVAASIRWDQRSLRTAALLPALVWIGLAGSLAIDALRSDGRAAVLTASEAVARSADSALSPAAFPEPLPGGTELDVVEARSPWLRVRLADGRGAWLPESSITPVARPPS